MYLAGAYQGMEHGVEPGGFTAVAITPLRSNCAITERSGLASRRRMSPWDAVGRSDAAELRLGTENGLPDRIISTASGGLPGKDKRRRGPGSQADRSPHRLEGKLRGLLTLSLRGDGNSPTMTALMLTMQLL